MGRGLAYLNKKHWHPGSYENQEVTKLAEQRDKEERKKAEAIVKKRKEEEELYRNRLAVMTDEERAKVKCRAPVDFLYNPPPGLIVSEEERKEREEKEAQAKSKAPPRRDPRFQLGKPMQNVRCYRCGQFGHAATDKSCPKYAAAQERDFRKITEDPAIQFLPTKEFTMESGDRFMIKSLSVDPGNAAEYCLEEEAEAEDAVGSTGMTPEEERVFMSLSSEDRERLLDIMDKKAREGSIERSRRKRSRSRGRSRSRSRSRDRDTSKHHHHTRHHHHRSHSKSKH